jgi:hypothetical protein
VISIVKKFAYNLLNAKFDAFSQLKISFSFYLNYWSDLHFSFSFFWIEEEFDVFFFIKKIVSCTYSTYCLSVHTYDVTLKTKASLGSANTWVRYVTNWHSFSLSKQYLSQKCFQKKTDANITLNLKREDVFEKSCFLNTFFHKFMSLFLLT